MFDLEYYASLKKFECCDDLQCDTFREMYKNKTGKHSIHYTNNDIKNMIFKANNRFEDFKVKFEKKEMTQKMYHLLTKDINLEFMKM